ncbi:Yae1-N domain-containing protein, partial [Favolaschia claudopus]
MAFCEVVPSTQPVNSGVSPLLQLPEEIIEYIAECMRYPIYPHFEATEVFLNEGRTGFSAVRFSLSSFSQVCKAIRPTAERLLYRDIHLDIAGWTNHIHSFDTRKHLMWPAGCLRLLLRTLETRADLLRFVRTVAVRWSDWPFSFEEITAKLRFLQSCEGLYSLSFSMVPNTLLEALESLNLSVTSFSAVSMASDTPRIIQALPALKNLHLHIHGQPSLYSIPPHNISSMHLALVGDRRLQKPLLNLALAVARNARSLSLDSLTKKGDQEALSIPPPAMRSSVENLRLKQIDPFTMITSGRGNYFPLTTLTALRHLHLVRPSLLKMDAFSDLPPRLRSITFSEYTSNSTTLSAALSKTEFVKSVVDCLHAILTYGAIPDDHWELAKVPFMQIGAFADIEPELMIF